MLQNKFQLVNLLEKLQIKVALSLKNSQKKASITIKNLKYNKMKKRNRK